MSTQLVKEPLFHFLILAIAIFGLSSWFSDTTSVEEPGKIVVTEQRVKSIVLAFQRTWGRAPTPPELDNLIRDFIQEEVFYREALAMQLDLEDTLIRRRLRQKLEFVAEDFANLVEPTEEELQKHLADHLENYRVERQATFTHVFLSREQRGESLEADANELLTRLQADKQRALDVTQLGDRTLLPQYQENLRAGEISDMFGEGFGTGVVTAEVDRWSGPIKSAFGLHLVCVHQKTDGRIPQLDEVRDAVRRDWLVDRRAQSKEAFFQKLLDKYEVQIERPKNLDTKEQA